MQKTETGGRNIEQKQAAETVSRNSEQKRRPENGKTENGYGLKQKQTETHENGRIRTDTDGHRRRLPSFSRYGLKGDGWQSPALDFAKKEA